MQSTSFLDKLLRVFGAKNTADQSISNFSNTVLSVKVWYELLCPMPLQLAS